MAESQSLLIILGAAVVAAVMGGWFLVERYLERRRPKQTRPPSDTGSAETILLKAVKDEAVPVNLQGRIDHSFRLLVERSGLGINPEQALGMVVVAGLVAAALLYVWQLQLWVMPFGFILGAAGALCVFWYYQAKRRQLLQSQLPDTLFSLSRSLRAGLSLEQAIAHTGEEGLRPLSHEFTRCAEQLYLGLSVPAALQLMANRVGLADFNAFVSLVLLHRAAGGNLPLLLDRLANSIRDRNQFRGYFRSATAQARITAFAIALSVPALLVGYLILQPESFQVFFNSAAGLAALGLAIGLVCVGLVWMYFLLQIDY